MKFKNKVQIEVDNSLIIILVLTILFKEIFIFFYFYFISYLFIIIHEFSHILVARIFNIKTNKIYFKLGGMCANIIGYNNKNIVNIIILLAGPISNILFALIFINNNYICNINLIFAVLNLVPIKPLDGYNILSKVINNKHIIRVVYLLSIVTLFFLNIFYITKSNNYIFTIILMYILNIYIQNVITIRKNK